LKIRRLINKPKEPLFRWILPTLTEAHAQLNMVRNDNAAGAHEGNTTTTGTNGVGAIPLQEVRVEVSPLPSNGHESLRANGTVVHV
jgi:hypothetical protein